MQYMLDDRKMFWIVGIILGVVIIVYLLPNKKDNFIVLTPQIGNTITGYEPGYFNNEIYTLPNAKMSPYYLAGGNDPTLDYHNQFTNFGFNQLRPTVELIPKTKQIPHNT